jgi:hypothetical protein
VTENAASDTMTKDVANPPRMKFSFSRLSKGYSPEASTTMKNAQISHLSDECSFSREKKPVSASPLPLPHVQMRNEGKKKGVRMKSTDASSIVISQHPFHTT